MQDELYLSGWEIEEISKTLTKYGDEVNTLVEKAASERAARYAYDHPKLPEGFVTITQLQGGLDLGDLRDEVEDFDFDGDRESLADEILNDLSYDEDYAPTDDAKDTIMGTVSAAFKERYGDDFAEVATDFGQDINDIAGRANPYVLSVDTVRAVNEKGYDAVFAEQWKAELSECDIDPEAVSVDSEAHDMENGRDGLDGNAPEKDAPEKDDRDAQPSVDTDNR